MTARALRLPLLAASLLALAALLAAPAGALAAKTRMKVYPAETNASISVPGTHGWRFEVDGLRLGAKAKDQSVTLDLDGPDQQSVSYADSHGRVDADGPMRVVIPGVARIEVEYEKTKTETLHVRHPKGCTSASSTTDSQGIYRGTIHFRGEGGFTTVDRDSARGSISTSPRQTCRVRGVPKHERVRNPDATAEKLGFEWLEAERKLGSGTLTFTALSHKDLFEESGPREVEFTALYSHHRDGLWIDASTSAEGSPEDFSLSAPTGTPSEATIEPPAPFRGTASFTLESPTTASWVGDLRVPVATLGTVELTGSPFHAALCLDLECTKTMPSGFRLGFIYISSGPVE